MEEKGNESRRAVAPGTAVRTAFLLLTIFTMVFITGCVDRDNGILLGSIGSEKVPLGNFAYEFWDVNNSYIAVNEYYKEKYELDILEGEDLTGDIRDEAFKNLVSNYVLAQKALKEGESLSTQLQEDNQRRAEGIIEELSEEFIYEYKITKEDLSRYLDYRSLAGIWFGKRIEELKETAQAQLEGAKGYEIKLKAYSLFEEEYDALLSETNVELDNVMLQDIKIQNKIQEDLK